MTAFQWFTVIQTVATLFLAIVMGVMFRGFATGRWVQTRIDDVEKVTMRVGALERRMDQANEEMSRLSSDVQGLPETLRSLFVPRETYLEGNIQNRDNYAGLRREVERLWDAVRARGGRS